MTATNRGLVAQDCLIEQVKEVFECTVLWCEGRPCLEYKSEEELVRISEYVKGNFDKELHDVFFTAIESISE